MLQAHLPAVPKSFQWLENSLKKCPGAVKVAWWGNVQSAPSAASAMDVPSTSSSRASQNSRTLVGEYSYSVPFQLNQASQAMTCTLVTFDVALRSRNPNLTRLSLPLR